MKKPTKSAFTLVELIVVIIIISILGTMAYISLEENKYPTKEEIKNKQAMCDLNGEQVKVNSNNYLYCGFKRNKVMECIEEYTRGIDEKYNNPDIVTNLREDNYSEVVKSCNEIFGKKEILK